MSEMRTPSGRGSGPLVPLGAVLALIVVCAGLPYVYFFRDYDYVQGTARALQDLLVATLTGLAIGAALLAVLGLAAAAIGLRFLWFRTAHDLIRDELRYRGETALEAARQSQYPNLTTYTYSPRYEYEQVAAAPAPPALAAPAVVAPALPAPPPGELLPHLRAQGLIGAPNRLTLGLSGGEGVPVEIGAASMVAVGGSPRMGKSTFAVWLISQAVVQGWPVFLCDPHGTDPQSILGRLEPVAHLLARAATTRDAMAEAVAAFDALGHGRLHGGDADRTPALLVLDELPALALSGQLPPATMETLIRIGSQYPKVHLLMVGIGYDWSASLFNSPYAAPLRRLTLPRVTVNADPATAKHLVGEQLAKQARDLRRGQALYLAYGAYGTMDVPQVTREDLAAVAPSCPAPPAAPALLVIEPAGGAGVAAATPVGAVEPPLDERILAHLAAANGPQTSTAISTALGADNDQVCARLNELLDAGVLSRSGSRRSYAYALPRSHTPPRGA